MFTNFKNSFTDRLSDKCVVNNSSLFKCLAALPCDLSLITIHISHWRHISDIHISQGSVATCLRRGGIFNQSLLQIYCQWKKNWKSANIWWTYGQKLGVLFLDSQCIKTDSQNRYVIRNMPQISMFYAFAKWMEFAEKSRVLLDIFSAFGM